MLQNRQYKVLIWTKYYSIFEKKFRNETSNDCCTCWKC